MDEQISLLTSALQQRLPGGTTAPIDISVSRQYGESTVTMRTSLGGGGVPAPSMVPGPSFIPNAPAAPLSSLGILPASKPAGGDGPPGGITRAYTRNSFYEDESEVPALLAEIERLKRKALSRGVNLTSANEGVPAEDVATLRQVFAIADETGQGSGEIDREQLGQLHIVLGEPLTEEELTSAFKAIDANRSGTISFEDFLAWYTLAHSSSGMLSKKGSSYTSRFQKIMNKLQSQFDIKHLTTATTGEPKSLDYRVQFHYNDGGQLKQISPWHDIPLFSPEATCT